MNRKSIVLITILVIGIVLGIAISQLGSYLISQKVYYGPGMEMLKVQITGFTGSQMNVAVKNYGPSSATISSIKINNSTGTIYSIPLAVKIASEYSTSPMDTEKEIIITGTFASGTNYTVILRTLYPNTYNTSAVADFS